MSVNLLSVTFQDIICVALSLSRLMHLALTNELSARISHMAHLISCIVYRLSIYMICIWRHCYSCRRVIQFVAPEALLVAGRGTTSNESFVFANERNETKLKHKWNSIFYAFSTFITRSLSISLPSFSLCLN